MKHRLYRDVLLQPSRHQSATLFQKRWVSYSHGGWLDEAHTHKKIKEQYSLPSGGSGDEGRGGEVKKASESLPLAHKKHHPTLTGDERRPFFLVLPWLLQIMMWWVRMTLPAAMQTSLVWYAIGQRMQWIRRPGKEEAVSKVGVLWTFSEIKVEVQLTGNSIRLTCREACKQKVSSRRSL